MMKKKKGTTPTHKNINGLHWGQKPEDREGTFGKKDN